MPGTRKIVDVSEDEQRGYVGSVQLLVLKKRTVTTTVAETVGLVSLSEAESVTPASGFRVTGRRPAGEAFWTVTEERTVYGDWEDIT